MMKKLTLVAAVGVGYVLGSRAGRERYEQIRDQAQKVAGNPRVQAAAAKTQETVAQQASAAASVVGEKAAEAASAVKDKVTSSDEPAGPATPTPPATPTTPTPPTPPTY